MNSLPHFFDEGNSALILRWEIEPQTDSRPARDQAHVQKH